jgi:hypothetical protein
MSYLLLPHRIGRRTREMTECTIPGLEHEQNEDQSVSSIPIREEDLSSKFLKQTRSKGGIRRIPPRKARIFCIPRSFAPLGISDQVNRFGKREGCKTLRALSIMSPSMFVHVR